MATTLNPPIKTAHSTWLYTWSGTAPFRVYNYESDVWLYEDTALTSLEIIGASDDEPPALAVFDSTETADEPETTADPVRVILQWRGNKYADTYAVKLDGTELTTLLETGAGYYQYTTNIVDDTEQVYTVTMTDKSGATVEVDFTFTISPFPAVPVLQYTYDANTGDVTIDA